MVHHENSDGFQVFPYWKDLRTVALEIEAGYYPIQFNKHLFNDYYV